MAEIAALAHRGGRVVDWAFSGRPQWDERALRVAPAERDRRGLILRKSGRSFPTMLRAFRRQFERVQVCALQIRPPSTQPLSWAVFAPVKVKEPE